MKKKIQKTTEKTTQSTFNYSPIPSSTKLMEVIAAMPKVPTDWEKLPSYRTSLEEWRVELQQAAHDVCSAANDSTGLMAEIIDGKRKIDDGATRMIAMVTAVRA